MRRVPQDSCYEAGGRYYLPVIDNIYDQLRRDEGVRSTLYRDELGNATVGVGHNLSTPLSTRSIQVILEDDVAAVQQELREALPWAEQLDAVRYGVLTNLAFNMGVVGLQSFARMLRACEAGAWNDAAAELLNSRYAKQTGDRAQRLATQLQTGVWQ
jgi:lysozyme